MGHLSVPANSIDVIIGSNTRVGLLIGYFLTRVLPEAVRAQEAHGLRMYCMSISWQTNGPRTVNKIRKFEFSRKVRLRKYITG